ncbi:MAG: S9 family peptidase [Firmicutes bacterium]|nr:S9 family peptidase [Bacillota bacterium]
MKKIKIDQYLKYNTLWNLRYSPDGKKAVFVAYYGDYDENVYKYNLYLLDLESGETRRLTSLGSESSFFWEDDTHILFPAVRSPKEKKRKEAGESFTSYYRLAVDGGEAMPAFELPLPAGELFPTGDGRFYFTSSINKLYPDFYKEGKEGRDKINKEIKADADYVIMEENPFWTNGGTYTLNKRTALFIYDPKSGEVCRITEPSMAVASVAAQGGKIFYLGEAWEGSQCNMPGFYSYDLKKGKTETICEKGEKYFKGIFKYMDGLFVLMSEGKVYEGNETPFFWFYDLKEGLKLMAENYIEVGNAVGTDYRRASGYHVRMLGDKIFFNANIGSADRLFVMGPDGKPEQIYGGEGSIDMFDINEKGEIICVALLDMKLQEVYKMEMDGSYKQLTKINEDKIKNNYIAKPNRMTIQSEGLEVTGWVLEPWNYDPAKKYPAILDIHGGPRTAYGEVYFHEMQFWANQGYFVFFCNPVGSNGGGDKFADIWHGYGDKDYKNIMDFTDAVLAKYPAIDEKRVGVTGGSYGGFMTNWIVGHTDRFACAATQRSISNWFSFWGVSDIGMRFVPNQHKAHIYEDADQKYIWDISPLKYAKNFKTPLLIIHSDADYRCPIPDGYQMFTAYKELGLDCRMVIFKGENHELNRSGKPQHRLRRLTEISNWFDKYLK